MGLRLGAFLDGVNVILRGGTGGKIIAEPFFDMLKLKGHNGYEGSDLKYISRSITTTDTTTTPIISIPVASGRSVHGIFLVGAKQDDESDATSALVVAAATNAAGTTAVKGTQSVTIVESAAGTNVTATADDTADELRINAVGITSENWLWTAHGFYMFMDSAA
jgi:hypothetical protein